MAGNMANSVTIVSKSANVESFLQNERNRGLPLAVMTPCVQTLSFKATGLTETDR
ncbi:hypothetical protein AWB69_02877 [Caballeronia udeis]|uniref:Uncharacterized protein n=1 Tax=Caballeronia udeis TaxID=1232866 RepID=A0A158GLI3_9BURK|nr:hypothetical protein AWB69_02877 [Caballeronia udeis]